MVDSPGEIVNISLTSPYFLQKKNAQRKIRSTVCYKKDETLLLLNKLHEIKGTLKEWVKLSLQKVDAPGESHTAKLRTDLVPYEVVVCNRAY